MKFRHRGCGHFPFPLLPGPAWFHDIVVPSLLKTLALLESFVEGGAADATAFSASLPISSEWLLSVAQLAHSTGFAMRVLHYSEREQTRQVSHPAIRTSQPVETLSGRLPRLRKIFDIRMAV